MKDEKIFREKLHHHTIPVRDGLWDRIEAQLPPKKDRRALPLFWFTLFAATLLSGTMMIGMLNNRTNDTSITSPLQQDTPTNQPDPVVAQSSSADPDLAYTNTTNSNTTNSNTTNSNTSNTNTNRSIQDPDGDSPLSDRSHNPAAGAGAKKNNLKNSPLSPSPASQRTTRAEVLPISESASKQIDNNASTAANQASLASGLFNPVSFLPMAELNLSEEEILLPSIASAKPDPNCYKFGGLGSDYALSADIFAGPGFSPKTFEENGGEPGYSDARKETENYQYAWSAGARLNLHHRSGLSARLGLTYTQAGDLFDYTDSLATQSTTRIDSFFAADGTFLYTESSQVLILGTLIKKIHNTYRYLDIPLLVGYELPLGRSLLMVNVGPVINLTSSHEGQILDPMFHPRSINKGDPGAIDVYKTSLGLSIYLGAGAVVPISDHFSGIIEPSFLYRLKPVTLGSYPLNEHRHYAGLNLGIRYHFN